MSNIVLSHHASDIVPGSPYHKKTWKTLDEIAEMQECADHKRMLCLMKKYRRSTSSSSSGAAAAGGVVDGVLIHSLPLSNIYEDDDGIGIGIGDDDDNNEVEGGHRRRGGSSVVVGGNDDDDIETLELRLSQILDQADQLCSTTAANAFESDFDDEEEQEKEKDLLPPRNEPHQQQDDKDQDDVNEHYQRLEDSQQRLGHETFGFETDSTWDDFLNDLPLDS